MLKDQNNPAVLGSIAEVLKKSQEVVAVEEAKIAEAADKKYSSWKIQEGKEHSVPKTEKEKKLAALAEPKDKITHADVLKGRGVTKEDVDFEPEKETKKPDTPDDAELKKKAEKNREALKKISAAFAKKKVDEEVELEEAVSVSKKDYSWGKMVTIHHGADTSYPLHPEHQKAIKALRPSGEHSKTSFKDETGRQVHATREGDKVHLMSKEGNYKPTTVDYKHFDEQFESTNVEQIDELKKSTLGSYIKKASEQAVTAGIVGTSMGAGHTPKPNQPEPGSKQYAIMRKREAGVKKAVDKLTKEDVEYVEEAMTDADKETMKKRAAMARPELERTKDVTRRFGGGEKGAKNVEKGFRSTIKRDYKKMSEEWEAIEEAMNPQIAAAFQKVPKGVEVHMKHKESGKINVAKFPGGMTAVKAAKEHEAEMAKQGYEVHKRKIMEQKTLSVILDEARGRPRKNAAPASKSENDDDDYGPDRGPEADQNIQNHLKKSIDSNGAHSVKFADGSSHKVPAAVAHKVLSGLQKLKPADRAKAQDHVYQSHSNLMQVHKMLG